MKKQRGGRVRLVRPAGGQKERSHGEARSAVRELDTECRHVRAEQLR